jgi:two-component system, chemotaxis family, sensor kinase CheA
VGLTDRIQAVAHNAMKRFTIQGGLTLTIAIYTFALLATMAVGVLGLKQSNDALKQMYATDTAAITQLKTSSEMMLQVQLALGNYETLFSMGKASDDLLPNARAVLKRSDENWAAYLTKPRDAQESRAADAVQAARKALVSQALEPEFNVLSQNDYYRFHNIRGEAQSLSANYERAMNALEALQVAHEEARFGHAQTRFHLFMILSAFIVLGVFGVGVLARAALAEAIGRPLSRMQTMMSEIASSQDFTRRVPVGRMDEIGHSIVAFNGMIEKIQQSSLQLKQKTADIQAMLQNIQQGILTVVDGGVVHPEYSAYLEAIFETHEIAGRPLLDLVFGNTDVGSDARAQIEAALDACLGEDSINFSFNEHLLVNEIAKTMADGRVKTLDLSWSAITDENDTVVRLMLCVRDVTELRALAAEAGDQKRRLEMIGEILAVSEEKFGQFLETSSSFISENERIIRQYESADHDAVARLFRNMHTVKGNARTYSLQHLTSTVHEAEQRYDALRKGEGGDQWDQPVLIADLERVKAALERYSTINEVSLGRKGTKGGAAKSSGAARQLTIDIELIDQYLRTLESADPLDANAMLAMRESMHRALSQLGTEPLEEALGGVLDSLPSLARELGKEVPVTRIADHGYRIRSQHADTLNNVFTHLLRNSVDHGIESVADRVAMGKPAAGAIDLDLDLDLERDALRFTLSDDGRGLALGKIRRAAIERGWLGKDEAASDATIAGLIFRPGFSTAQTVSEISGRGVGMDAVREFITREQGVIELRFTDNHEGAEFRRFQTVVYLPQSWGVAVHAGGVASATLDAAASA